jgi:thiamine kinase-like enzyme
LPSLTLLKNQGFSNTNYLLKTSKKNYIIRVFGSLEVDRKKEFAIAKKAYELNIGAKPIYLDDSFMISEYLEGFHKTKLKKTDIKNIALVLKKLHSVKKRRLVLCHHDLNPKNIIFSKDIKLIDWEYAGFDECYFDLASTVIEFDLNQKEEKLLLHSYFKNKYDVNRNKIYSFKIKYLKLCMKWFKQQHNFKEQFKFKKRLNARNTR